jgi:membrane associated rhomboid family serine protease
VFNLTPIVKNLLIINVVMFALSALISAFDFADLFGLRLWDSRFFSPYQFITYIFIHASFWHLFSNMIGLIVFGPWLEMTWGSHRFLIFYAICGLGAGFLYLGVNFVEMQLLKNAIEAYMLDPTPDHFAQFMKEHNERSYYQLLDFVDNFSNNPDNFHYIQSSKQIVKSYYESRIDIPMVGASGAIFGVLAAFGLMFPNVELMLLFPPIPIKAKYLIGIYMLFAIFGAVNPTPGDNVAHYAHIGGAIFGWIMVNVWKNKHF